MNENNNSRTNSIEMNDEATNSIESETQTSSINQEHQMFGNTLSMLT